MEVARKGEDTPTRYGSDNQCENGGILEET
jgi:hypothetical protein